MAGTNFVPVSLPWQHLPNDAVTSHAADMKIRRRDLGLALLATPALIRPAAAEVGAIRISKQYGLPYLPMLIMERQQIVERHAAKLGVASLRVEWPQLGGPVPQVDGLLSGNLEFIGPGIPTLATLWDKTAGTPQEVRALCAMQSMPFVLVTRNPDVHSIADFTAKDKIALPGIKLVGHALALEVAAAKQWGFDQFDRLDPLTVTLSHPDAMAALLGGQSEVNSHFASSPFYYYELAAPGIHQVLKSYDAWGGRHTNGVLLASKRFHDANPKICAAVLAAQTEANELIKADPKGCAKIYLEMTGDKKVGLDEFATWVADPDVDYTTTPNNAMPMIEFMHRVGRIKRLPGSWKDLFFPEAHGLAGS
jgi:NitT/TauT family transport system substrate-binding protein